MKNILLISFIVFFTMNASSQNWMTDLEESKKLASGENKKIILVFQGSDWCAPCIKLEKKILLATLTSKKDYFFYLYSFY